MARFNLNGFLDNSRFEDFFARFGGGSSDHDHLNGTTGNNTLFGGANEDTLGWWASLAELGDTGSADADDVGNGGQGVAVLAEPGDALAAEPGGLGDAGLELGEQLGCGAGTVGVAGDLGHPLHVV